MAFKIVYSLVAIPLHCAADIYMYHHHNQRKSNEIHPDSGHDKLLQIHFFPSSDPLWNPHPQEVTEAQELEQFKDNLAKIYLNAIH